jgi:hypothetical protein
VHSAVLLSGFVDYALVGKAIESALSDVCASDCNECSIAECTSVVRPQASLRQSRSHRSRLG